MGAVFIRGRSKSGAQCGGGGTTVPASLAQESTHCLEGNGEQEGL